MLNRSACVKKFLFVFTINLLVLLSAARAQTAAAKQLTIEQIFADGGIAGRAPETIKWSPDGSKVSFVQRDDAGEHGELWYVDTAKGEKQVLVSEGKLSQLAPPTSHIQNEREKERVTRYHVAAYTWSPDSQHLLFDSQGQLWYYSLDTGTAVQLTSSPDASEDPKFSPDGKRLAYVRKHNLYVHPVAGEEGGLTAKGDNAADLKRTALGNVQIQMQQGTLKQFATLSKILSILNVSQLLKFQLPDMSRGGMPYDKITATLSFKDGTVSSKDLFVKSNAMNISAIGNLDMVKGEIFQTNVGVQLFQSVDKLVSLIPVVGWILTDKNRGFMTAYFEVKGNVDDPVVTAIPFKAMGRGVFDIFKNVFQLPAKVFTDTGEVFLGR